MAAIQFLSSTTSANEFNLKIVGKRQGPFRAPKTGLIPVFGYDLRGGFIDPNTGASLTARKYQPLIIKKDLDLSSPQFLAAMSTNEELTSVVLQAKVTTRDGTVSQAYTIILTGARVVDIHQLPDERGSQYEEVSIAFQTIRVENGAVSAQDSIAPN